MSVLNIYDQKGILKPGQVYIGNSSKKYPDLPKNSKWGNPFRVGFNFSKYSKSEALQLYKDMYKGRPDLQESIHLLHGRDLVCFCAPAPCHGDFLLEKAAERVREMQEGKNGGQGSHEEGKVAVFGRTLSEIKKRKEREREEYLAAKKRKEEAVEAREEYVNKKQKEWIAAEREDEAKKRQKEVDQFLAAEREKVRWEQEAAKKAVSPPKKSVDDDDCFIEEVESLLRAPKKKMQRNVVQQSNDDVFASPKSRPVPGSIPEGNYAVTDEKIALSKLAQRRLFNEIASGKKPTPATRPNTLFTPKLSTPGRQKVPHSASSIRETIAALEKMEHEAKKREVAAEAPLDLSKKDGEDRHRELLEGVDFDEEIDM